jgi:hypothetical protein
MRLEITEEDIKRGSRSSPENCPLAFAFARAFPSARDVKVHNGKVEFDWKGVKMESKLDRQLSEKIAEYDKTGHMEPTIFSSVHVPIGMLNSHPDFNYEPEVTRP